MGRRANVKPPLIINSSNTGYDTASLEEDDNGETTVQEADEIEFEGSQRGKKKRKTRTDSNELINFLKQKWNDDKEAEGIIHAENQVAREKHLSFMERNTEAACSIAESFKIMAERRN